MQIREMGSAEPTATIVMKAGWSESQLHHSTAMWLPSIVAQTYSQTEEDSFRTQFYLIS